MYIQPADIEALLIAVTGDYAASVFVKQDNYVVAHVTRTVRTDKTQFSRDWWCNYLLGECKLNREVLDAGQTVNMFVGDAAHHSWVFHYQITKRSDRYDFKRSN
jgi:hypothetical protein